MPTIEAVVVAAARFRRGALNDSRVAWNGQVAYVLGYDLTLMMRIEPVTNRPQPDAVSFFSADWQGRKCRASGDQVEWVPSSGAVMLTRAPDESYDDLNVLWRSIYQPLNNTMRPMAHLVTRQIRPLLDENVPHVEFVGKDGALDIIQHDIFTGRVLRVARQFTGGSSFGPLAFRTEDLLGLMGLAREWRIIDHGNYWYLTDTNGTEALVGGCVYDSLGELSTLMPDKEKV